MPIVPTRKLSYGEIQALKRLQAYTKAKEATLPKIRGSGVTAVIKPPSSSYGSLMLAPDND